jgi:hypothetical protein
VRADEEDLSSDVGGVFQSVLGAEHQRTAGVTRGQRPRGFDPASVRRRRACLRAGGGANDQEDREGAVAPRRSASRGGGGVAVRARTAPP